MNDDELRDDVAQSTAVHIVEGLASRLTEEERGDAFVAIYQAVLAGIECFQVQQQRPLRDIHPSIN